MINIKAQRRMDFYIRNMMVTWSSNGVLKKEERSEGEKNKKEVEEEAGERRRREKEWREDKRQC